MSGLARVALVLIGVALGAALGQAIGLQAGRTVAQAYEWLDRGFGAPQHAAVSELLEISLTILGLSVGAAVGGLLSYRDGPVSLEIGDHVQTAALRSLAIPAAHARRSLEIGRTLGGMALTSVFGLLLGGVLGLSLGYAAALLYFSLDLFGLETDGFVGMALTLWGGVGGLLVGLALGTYQACRPPLAR